MKLRLLRDCRIRHLAGETVEVSPAEAAFLITTGSAVEADGETVRGPQTIAREVPEDGILYDTGKPEIETPEGSAEEATAKSAKTTRTRKKNA